MLRPKGGVATLLFGPAGTTLATGASNKSLATLWDTTTGQLKAELKGEEGFLYSEVSGMNFSRDGRWLETHGPGKRVRLWNLETGKLITTLSGFGDFISVKFSPDSRTLAMTSFEDSRTTLWDVSVGHLLKSFVVPKQEYALGKYSTGAIDLAFSPNGQTLATAVAARVYLWSIPTGEIRLILIGHNSTIYEIAFSPDGRTLATISRDTTAKLWDAASGHLKATLAGHKGGVRRMAFSPNGQTLVTGSQDETAKLWDVTTGRLIATLPGHKDTVWSISFSADSRIIATASGKTAKLWDAQTGELKQTFDGMRAPLAFSPVAPILATAAKDGTVVLWDVRH